MGLKDILTNMPEVTKPLEKKVSFSTKLKWTLIILISFFVLSNIPLYGIVEDTILERFEMLAMLMGTNFGSVISLGIGPIVMSSIILQLLVGAQILNLDLKTVDGKRYFQGLQKILALFFCLFEAMAYVLMKGLEAMPNMDTLVITQLVLGGVLIIFMDEVVSKWGFGSGVSLFIAAGVGWQLFTTALSPLDQSGKFAWFSENAVIGKVWSFFNSISIADTTGAISAFAAIFFTVAIFLIVVYSQSIKVEIPLSFGRIRGYGIRWPLNFFYTSVIPVILVSAVIANMQIVARLAENIAGKPTFLGTFSGGTPVSGLAFWLSSPQLIDNIIRGSFKTVFLWQSLTYALFMVAGCIIFSLFWVKTAGMDAASQAKNMIASGLQIPGFRRDQRVLESILERYITPLAVMGGAAIGLLAAVADLMGALIGGTSILLGTMIVYQLYNEIAQQHAYDMYPALKKIISK